MINLNGYYVSEIPDESHFEARSMPNSDHDTIVSVLETKYNSIMFYNNGLCTSLSTRVATDKNRIISILDTLYSSHIFSNKNVNEFCKKGNTSWGTYEVNNDTVKVFLIENLIGCDGTRKRVISTRYLISNDKQLKQIYIANSNKEYGYKKTLDISNSIFYPIENKRDSLECPYLTEKWFYKKDKVK